jgi:hypothetical protein
LRHKTARNKEEEDKRVFKEMAHIRNTFKEAKKLDGYNRKKGTAFTNGFFKDQCKPMSIVS